MSVVIYLGRWWNVWRVIIEFWNWNFNSILLEVALCIMLYTLVLWIELAPAFVHATAPGGTIILAGLLDTQADAVVGAYAAEGCSLVERGPGEWTVLVLRRA